MNFEGSQAHISLAKSWCEHKCQGPLPPPTGSHQGLGVKGHGRPWGPWWRGPRCVSLTVLAPLGDPDTLSIKGALKKGLEMRFTLAISKPVMARPNYAFEPF